MTRQSDFPKVMACKNDLATVCEFIKDNVGMFYDLNIMSRVADCKKGFRFVIDDGVEDARWTFTNATYDMKRSVQRIDACRAPVEFGRIVGGVIQSQECLFYFLG